MKTGYSKNRNLLLSISGMNVATPTGRLLIRDLNLTMGYEKVALIGHNGVGKSTLLTALSEQHLCGQVKTSAPKKPHLMPQMLDKSLSCQLDVKSSLEFLSGTKSPDHRMTRELSSLGLQRYGMATSLADFSAGEARKLHLLAAKYSQAELLLLDEPTDDLDEIGICWLQQFLTECSSGLIVVSHDRLILQLFSQFLIVAESGCRYFSGTFDQLEKNLTLENIKRQKNHRHETNRLCNTERHSELILRRRLQKKNQGRWRELGRMTPKTRLNQKRSSAQESQAKVARVGQDRLEDTREHVKSERRQVPVVLQLTLGAPSLPINDGVNIVTLQDIAMEINGREMFKDINLTMQRNRIAITGPNGAGKTTLLKIILNQQIPTSGTAKIAPHKIGYIAQGAENWILDESLISTMLRLSKQITRELVIHTLKKYRFPCALGERSLSSLSSGERVRAALICLITKAPTVELLILDEPTCSLDFFGVTVLQAALKDWPGGLIVVSHDHEFLKASGVSRYLRLDGFGGHRYSKEM